MRKINYIVIHCTATSPKATVQAIKNGWFKPKPHGRGWKTAGYHYLIDRHGKVHVLVPEAKQSNGVRGHNHEIINVSYIGGVEDGKAVDTRTDEQKEAMLNLVLEQKVKYPKATVQGHRDFSPDRNKNGKVDSWERIKECPCFNAKIEFADV